MIIKLPIFIDDLEQEAYLGAIEAINKHDPEREYNLEDWARIFVDGRMIDLVRREYRQKDIKEKLSKKPSYYEFDENEIDIHIIKNKINKLSEETKELFNHLFSGVVLTNIGKKMGITEHAARTLYFNALKELKNGIDA